MANTHPSTNDPSKEHTADVTGAAPSVDVSEKESPSGAFAVTEKRLQRETMRPVPSLLKVPAVDAAKEFMDETGFIEIARGGCQHVLGMPVTAKRRKRKLVAKINQEHAFVEGPDSSFVASENRRYEALRAAFPKGKVAPQRIRVMRVEPGAPDEAPQYYMTTFQHRYRAVLENGQKPLQFRMQYWEAHALDQPMQETKCDERLDGMTRRRRLKKTQDTLVHTGSSETTIAIPEPEVLSVTHIQDVTAIPPPPSSDECSVDVYEDMNAALLDSKDILPVNRDFFLRFQASHQLQTLLEQSEVDPGLREALCSFVRHGIAYANDTGEMIDCRGTNNIVFFWKNGAWTYRIIDAFLPKEFSIPAAQEAVRRLRDNPEAHVDPTEMTMILNVLNFVRTMNGMAKLLGLPDRINFLKEGETLPERFGRVYADVHEALSWRHGKQRQAA